ncbi:hypothetical protein VZT92_009275 [Zoarces viviparus]|uniref:NADH dehydrogenase subunit 4 n=1 Tax=Zoarces viviparus TaxID=48416 RepID=A0AAW1FHD2_ZOAVI
MLLNPTNLNSTEMVHMIRAWISASVLLLTLCWLVVPTPGTLWVTPVHPSINTLHPSIRAYDKPTTSVGPRLPLHAVSSPLRPSALSALFIFSIFPLLPHRLHHR